MVMSMGGLGWKEVLLLLPFAAFAVSVGYAEQGTGELKPVEGSSAVLTAWGLGPSQFREAKDVGVRQAISFNCDPKYLAAMVKEGKEYGISVYGCVKPIDKNLPQQEMNDQENAFAARILADKTREKNRYQFGGEPYHPLEVSDLSIACFHHESVREAVKKKIRDVAMVDEIAGVAFDFFGYRNYRCCRCPLSMKLAGAYHEKRPELKEKRVLEAFSLESLVAFNNDMADYARSLKSSLRVTCHVHPVFLRGLLYGNRLKLDECCQTAAWFMEPFWSKQRIADHVKVIFGQEKKYWPFAEGAALLGTTATKDAAHPPKSPQRIELELRTMLQAGADRIHVCSWSDVMKSPEHTAVFKRIFAPDPPATKKRP